MAAEAGEVGAPRSGQGLRRQAGAGIAADRMGVSRQTYARILTRARTAVARSLVEEKILLVGDAASEAILDHAPARPDCPVHGGSRRHGRAWHCVEGEADAPVPYAGCRHRTT